MPLGAARRIARIDGQEPSKSHSDRGSPCEADELATLEWGDGFNHRRLLELIGYMHLAEADAHCWQQQTVRPCKPPDSNQTASMKRGADHAAAADGLTLTAHAFGNACRFITGGSMRLRTGLVLLLLTLALSACTPRQSVPDAAQLRNMAKSFLGQLRLPVDMVAVEAPVLISAHEHADAAGRILKLTLDLRYRLLVSGVDLDSARVSRAQGMHVLGAVFALQNDIRSMVSDPSHSIYAAHAGDVLVYKATVDLRRGHAGHWHVIAGEVARLPRIEQAAPPGRSTPPPTSSVATATKNVTAAPTRFAAPPAPPTPATRELGLSFADISLLQPVGHTIPTAPPQTYDFRNAANCASFTPPSSDPIAQAAVHAGWLIWRASVADGSTRVLQLAAGMAGQCLPEGLADLVVHNGQILALIRSGATVQFMGPSLRGQGRTLHLAIDRYAPEDAHCCPSIHQSIDFAVGIHGLSISRIQDNAPAVSSAATMATPQAATYSHDAPSFDCARAATPVEHAICDNPTLSRLDGRMGKLYAQRLAVDPGERKHQIDWIRARNAACGANVGCLIAAEHARMQALQQQVASD